MFYGYMVSSQTLFINIFDIILYNILYIVYFIYYNNEIVLLTYMLMIYTRQLYIYIYIYIYIHVYIINIIIIKFSIDSLL